MSVTLRDIAIEAAVSEGTVSLALNNRPGVSPETRKRILEIAKQRGYIPSLNAKSLALRNNRLIGLLVPNLQNLFRSAIVQEIENVLQQNDYRMIFSTTNSNGDYEKRMIEQFVAFRVKCIILYPSIKSGLCPDYMNLLRKNNIPLVFLNGYYDDVDAPFVMSDTVYAGSLSVEHLISKGYRHPIYLGANRNIVSSRLKIIGMTEALEKHGLVFSHDDYVELEHTNYDNAYFAIDRLVQEGKDFDSVITGDHYSAFGALSALKKHGRKVPEEVGIIHYNNFLPPDMCAMRMTCIEQNVPLIAQTVVESIDKILSGQPVQSANIPVRFLCRDSTAKS